MARIGQPHATGRSAMPRVPERAARIDNFLGDLCYVEIQARPLRQVQEGVRRAAREACSRTDGRTG